ncbi:MAG: hypothetical protein U1B80_05850, partial [Anaerolineaceae bacterium]|nr:hypothetical protein [Anaerolineaceae bacterium]
SLTAAAASGSLFAEITPIVGGLSGLPIGSRVEVGAGGGVWVSTAGVDVVATGAPGLQAESTRLTVITAAHSAMDVDGEWGHLFINKTGSIHPWCEHTGQERL